MNAEVWPDIQISTTINKSVEFGEKKNSKSKLHQIMNLLIVKNRKI